MLFERPGNVKDGRNCLLVASLREALATGMCGAKHAQFGGDAHAAHRLVLDEIDSALLWPLIVLGLGVRG